LEGATKKKPQNSNFQGERVPKKEGRGGPMPVKRRGNYNSRGGSVKKSNKQIPEKSKKGSCLPVPGETRRVDDYLVKEREKETWGMAKHSSSHVDPGAHVPFGERRKDRE